MLEARRSPNVAPAVAVAGLAAVAGLVVAAAGAEGGRLQLAIAAALALIGPLFALYALRPYAIIWGFIFLLPLLVSSNEATGLSPSVVASGAFLMLFIPDLVLHRVQISPAARKIVWPLIGITILGLISALANSVTTLSDLSNSVFKYGTFAIVFVAVYAHTNTKEKAAALMRALLAGGIAVALYSIFMYVTGRSYLPEFGFSRAAGTFENWNELGGYMAMILLPTLTFAIARRKGWTKLFLIAMCLAELVALLLSQTLGSVLGLGVAGMVALFFYFRRLAGRLLIAFAVVSVVGIIVAQLVPAVGEHFDAAGSRVADRFETFTAGYAVLRAHPLLGVGTQTLLLNDVLSTAQANAINTSSVPHNAYLGIAAEKGIFGGLLLVILTLNAFRVMATRRNEFLDEFRLWHVGIVLGSVAFITQNMSNLLLLHARLGAIWLVMVALDIRLAELSSRDRERPVTGSTSSGADSRDVVGATG